MNNLTRVALIFGGATPEHGVSCLTAAGVLAVIDQTKYEVVGIGISRSGRWFKVPLSVIANYKIVDGKLPEVSDSSEDVVWLRGTDGCQIAFNSENKLTGIKDIDVAFTLLHGPYGEDGTVQGLLEMMGVRYVGSGVAASAVGMDKHLMKVLFESAGIPVGPYVAFDSLSWQHDRDTVLSQIADLEYPLYVKPARGGSSFGISRVTEKAQLIPAVQEAQRFDPKVIVEQGFVGAREIECAVLGDLSTNDGCIASAPGEIRMVTKDGFYDFEAKYISGDEAKLDVPADIEKELAEKTKEMAKAAFRSIGCEGLARVDVFITADGKVWLNEINTMPGFTEISMYPALWQAEGISYSELVARLLELALQRPLGLR